MEETSAGAVIFRRESEKIFFLLLHYHGGHWDFAKGKVEEGEKLIETARREIGEETGITNVVISSDFHEEIKYTFSHEQKIIHKKVIFFLAETETKDVTISHEHIDHVWLTFEDAMNKITYENARNILDKANRKIKSLSKKDTD
jgi:8-oxo-dGTP pyrophosphatase MutT (NUDIX family)